MIILYFLVFITSFLWIDVVNYPLFLAIGYKVFPIDLLFLGTIGFILFRRDLHLSRLPYFPSKSFLFFLMWIIFAVCYGFFRFTSIKPSDLRPVFPFFFFFVSYSLTRYRHLYLSTRLFRNVLIVSGIAVGLLFLIELTLGHRFGFSFRFIGEANYGFLVDARGKRILGTQDTFSALVLLILIILSYLFKRPFRFTFLWIFLLLAIILISQNRTAIFSLGITFILYSIFLLRSDYRVKFLVTAFLVFLFGVMIVLYVSPGSFNLDLSDYIQSVISPEKDVVGTGSWRFQMARAALSDFYKSPVIGTGYGTQWDLDVNRETYHMSPHNQYIAILVRTGLIGLFLYLLLFVSIIRLYFTYRNHIPGYARPLFETIFIALTAGIPYGFGFDIYPYFGFYLGYFLGVIQQIRTGRYRFARPAPLHIPKRNNYRFKKRDIDQNDPTPGLPVNRDKLSP